MDVEKLESMKYSELQKVAKENGIKANMKVRPYQ
jgi:beta-lactam-binding protein with PASTA domain